MARPACVAAVPLVIVPLTVTVLSERAYCGVTESMTSWTLPCAPVAACAGLVVAKGATMTVSTAIAATRSKLRTLDVIAVRAGPVLSIRSMPDE